VFLVSFERFRAILKANPNPSMDELPGL